MVYSRPTLPRWQIFLGLLTGLLTLGVAVTFFLYKSNQTHFWKSIDARMQQTAKFAAVIETEQLDTLTGPNVGDEADVAFAQKHLRTILDSSIISVNVSLVKRSGMNYYLIADASRLSPAKRNSRYYEPLADLDPTLLETFRTNAPTSSLRPFNDRWGNWASASAYVPGTEMAILVQADHKELLGMAQETARAFWVSVIVVSLLCVGFAWILAGVVGRSLPENMHAAKVVWRRPAIELFLLTAVVAVAIDAGHTYLLREQLQKEQGAAMMALNTIHKAQEISEKAIRGEHVAEESKNASVDAVVKYLPQKLSDLYIGVLDGTYTDPVAITDMLSMLIDQASVEQRQLSFAATELRGLDLRLIRAIVISTLLAAVALVIVRYASQQDRKIVEFQAESLSAQSEYKNVVENLPVGLFTVEGGKCTFSNHEWDKQVSLHPGADRQEAFLAAVHPDDRDQIAAILAQAEQTSTPFRVQYRIVRPDGTTRHVESQGTPVYGDDGMMKNLLAFSLDMTATAEAKAALQQAYAEVEQKNKLLGSALKELEQNLETVVRALVKAVEAKDPYTAGHSERVMGYSLWLGEAIGLGSYEMRVLELGTLIHDVGKIGIPDAILTKPDRLTDEEYAVIKKHPEYGENIIRDIGLFKECLPIVRWHHERLDGRGYPDGLKGNEIPLLVRISAIADIFDAMTSTRAYREGLHVDKVLETMSKIAENGEIDPQLFAVFCEVIRKRGIIPQTVIQEPWKAA